MVDPETSNPQSEPVWTFRGYQLKASEFNAAMVHFFRAEVSRANVWRMRLDATTNWAVVTTGAVLSFAFSQVASPHIVILLNLMLVTMFMVIEARRYRYYELWSSRVRLMETDFFAAMLVPPFHPSPDWAESLAENLLMPQFPVSNLEALGRRLRRNYLWIYTIVALSWLVKLWLFPQQAVSWQEFLTRAAVGSIPGDVVVVVVGVFLALIVSLALFTIGMHEATGEIFPRFEGLPANIVASLTRAGRQGVHPKAWFRRTRRRQQLLTLIITDQPQAITDRITRDLSRGATIVPAKGAFTQKEHSILMVALTVTEVPQLKKLVADEDSQAFVIVSPAQSIFGKGFIPLEEKE